MLQPQVIEKSELTVIGLEAAFIHALSPDATNFQVIGPLWDQFIQRATQVQNRLDDKMVGIIHDRPPAERSHPHELQYLAAAPVSSTGEIPEGMVWRIIPAGTFAVFTHRGPITLLGDTVREIYRVWLPQSGWQHAEIADVELYDHRFSCDREDSEMEYWISVRKSVGWPPPAVVSSPVDVA